MSLIKIIKLSSKAWNILRKAEAHPEPLPETKYGFIWEHKLYTLSPEQAEKLTKLMDDKGFDALIDLIPEDDNG